MNSSGAGKEPQAAILFDARKGESPISRWAKGVRMRLRGAVADFLYTQFQDRRRRDGRVAEGGGLLNRYRVKSSIGGSNPPLSASESFSRQFWKLSASKSPQLAAKSRILLKQRVASEDQPARNAHFSAQVSRSPVFRRGFSGFGVSLNLSPVLWQISELFRRHHREESIRRLICIPPGTRRGGSKAIPQQAQPRKIRL